MRVATLRDIILDSSNVTASSEPEYDSGTPYVTDDTVKVSFESDGTTPRTPVEEYIAIAGSTGSYPPDNPTDWTLTGASNRWKMFDGSTTSQTVNTNTIEVEIDSSNTDVVGVFNLDADTIEFTSIINSEIITNGDGSSDDFKKEIGWSYDAGNDEWDCDGTQITTSRLYQDGDNEIVEDLWCQVTFTIKNYTQGSLAGYAGGGNGDYESANGVYTQIIQVSNTDTFIGVIASDDFIGSVDDISVKFVPNYEEIDLSLLSKADYYEYFFEDFNFTSDIISYYPKYSNYTLKIKIDNTGSDAKCGLVVVGASQDMGFSERETPTTGINDFSIKTTDSVGRTILSQGDFAKRLDIETKLTYTEVDGLQRKLTSLRGIPALYDGNNRDLISEDLVSESLIIYGYYERFDILVPNTYGFSICNIRINGLT